MLIGMKKVFELGIKNKLFSDFDPYYLAVALEGISTALLLGNLEFREECKIDSALILQLFFNIILLGDLDSAV